MPIVPREGAFLSRKHKRSIISQSYPSSGRLLHARILKVDEALGAPALDPKRICAQGKILEHGAGYVRSLYSGTVFLVLPVTTMYKFMQGK